MDITLYQNKSVYNKINKNISQVGKYSAIQLAEGTDDYDVSIRFTVPTDTLKWSAVNYFSFDGAYYFLENVEKLRNGVSVVHGQMDVLMTYKSAILDLQVLAERSTSHGSMRLEDEVRSISVDSNRTEISFPNTLNTSESAGTYVLVTSQSGYTVETS